MSWPSSADRFQNPFSASRVRPGAVPFLFPARENAAALVARLKQAGWRGQIVGPHGSGKSSLLAALRSELEVQGLTTLLITLHDGERRLPVDLRKSLSIGAGAIVMVDGYEQLSWWSRWKLRRPVPLDIAGDCSLRSTNRLGSHCSRERARRPSWPSKSSTVCYRPNRQASHRFSLTTLPAASRCTAAICVSCCLISTIFTNRGGRRQNRQASSSEL